MKYRNLLNRLTIVLFIAFLTACNNGNVSIKGAWVRPVPGIPNMQQGFILEAGGKASSINMATLQYEAWEQKNNLLILSGKSIGNHQTIYFSDTLHIEKQSQNNLILRKGEAIYSYTRIEKDQIRESAPQSVIAPSNQTLSIKGKLSIGHEVRSFTATGDSVSYWIVDKTGKLMQKYNRVTNGIKNGTSVYVELEVIDMGPSNDGFAADYAGVYYVIRIVSLSLPTSNQ